MAIRDRRALAVGTVLVAAMAATALLLLVSPSSFSSSASLLAIVKPEKQLHALAMHLLRDGGSMSTARLGLYLKQWQQNPLILDDSSKARIQMLAPGNVLGATTLQDSTGSDSKLCAKKDVIIEKLDQLLRKLGGEELSLNITLGRVDSEWKAALDSWLEAESSYRLRIEQKNEATDGLKYVQGDYEKYMTAYKEAKANFDAMVAKHQAEREELDSERELIKEIMRMIGVLHDIKATDKSIAAGGRDSIKDPETGVSDPKTKAVLEAKISQLKQMIKKSGLIKGNKLAQITKLPVYSETEEIAKILKEMLDVTKSSRQIFVMVESEQKIAELGKARDKAKEDYEAEKLQREKLNGNEKILEIQDKEANANAKKLIPPYEREIYVITMIKIKINDHCSSINGAAAGADGTAAAPAAAA
eukprot:767531-Hanusia_phi.AAC.5